MRLLHANQARRSILRVVTLMLLLAALLMLVPILGKQRGFRDEITFIAPGGTEAVGISLWDSREQAEAYNSSGYSEVLKELNKLVEGTPQVKTYDVANSTAHNIAARPRIVKKVVRRLDLPKDTPPRSPA